MSTLSLQPKYPSKRMVYSATTLAVALMAVLIQSLWQTTVHQQKTTANTVSTTTQTNSITRTSTNARVVRVIDGDTLDVLADGSTNEEKVRMLGINTPESVDPRRDVQCFGHEASAFAKNLLEGHRVRLEEDPQADNIDKYGRYLRNVVLDDGRDVNLLLVQEGYAHAYLSFPLNKERKAEIRRAEAKAKSEQKGLWNPATCPVK